MDDKFRLFENRFKSQKNRWADIGITVKKASYEKATKMYYQNYRIELIAENSEGTITLFESNGCYWVDFECVNFDKDDISVNLSLTLKILTIFPTVWKNLKKL